MSSTDDRPSVEWLQRRITAAVDLTTLRDLESTLQEAVRFTRGLMGTELAYISFTDFAANETLIRKSDGVRTSAYANLRQPLGTGVLGRVAIGHASHWSADYLADAAIHRLDDVDAIVREEGVRAILASPLSASGRVIGSLAVAERASREFSPREVQQLESIAAQAAIAIDNAMRHEHAIGLLEQLDGAQQRDAQELALTARGHELDRRLMDSVTGGHGIQSIVTIGASTIGADLWFEEAPAGSTVASTSDAVPDRTAVSRQAVIAAGERVGQLVAARSLTGAEQELLERISTHLALAVLLRRARQDLDRRESAAALHELVSGAVREADVATVLERVGLGGHDRLCCIVIDKPDVLAAPVLSAMHSSAPTPIMTAALDADRLCVLAGDADWVEALPALFRAHGWTLRAGISWTDATAGGIVTARQRGELALSAMLTRDRTGLSDGSSLGLVAALMHMAREGRLPEGLTESIDPLIGHDVAHGSRLLETATVFFDADESAGRVAELLGVHRNTVRKRLARIGGLIGDDWLSAPRKLDVHLALRVHEAMQSS